MPPPTVTAVIPTFRRPELLERAIKSVLAQSYPHLKVLVCDNDSGDETAEVVADLRRRDPRVIYHCHSENIGAAASWFFGLRAVDTDYFALLSDDDVLLPDFYRHAIDAFERHPDAGFFCGQVIVYDQNRGTHGLRPHRDWEDGFYEAGRWASRMFDNQFYWTSCVWSATIPEQVGWKEIPQTGYLMDVLFLAQAAAQSSFVVTLAPCAVFAITGQNAYYEMSADDLLSCRRALYRACEELPNLSEDARRAMRTTVEEKMRGMANGLLRVALEDGDRRRFEDLAGFAREHGGQSWTQKQRTAIAGAGGPGGSLFYLMSAVTRLTAGYKRMRRSGWRRMSWDEVLERYTDDPSKQHKAPGLVSA